MRFAVLLPAALLLAPVLLAADGPLPIQPGRWTTVVTVLDFGMAGMPPGVGPLVRTQPTSVTSCVTPAQAAQGPRAIAQRSHGQCRMTQFAMTGGRISSVMTCRQPGGAMTMRSTGTYTPTSMTMEAVGSSTGPHAMHMRTRTVSRRVGAC